MSAILRNSWALGFAVLVPQSEPVETGWLLAHIRQSRDLDGERVGLLGFGAGAAVAVAAGEMPRALLYPACRLLGVAPDEAPFLLMQSPCQASGRMMTTGGVASRAAGRCSSADRPASSQARVATGWAMAKPGSITARIAAR